MKRRLYLIELEWGNRYYARNYNVVATSDEAAVRKAKRQANQEFGKKMRWRTVSLTEKKELVVP